jgi:hypothetical protein
MSDVTRLIKAVQEGNRQAAADLLPLVYDELRKLDVHFATRSSVLIDLDYSGGL